MDPADAVRALFDAVVAGDDHSVYATGELAESLRLEHESAARFESAARTTRFRRLRETANDGRSATLEVDVETHIAWKDPTSGAWEQTASRLRGRASVVHAGGRWLVADLPAGRGGSVVAAQRPAGATLYQDGDVGLDVRVATTRAHDSYSLRLRNEGDRALTPTVVLLERRALAVLPVHLRLPFVEPPTLAPGEAYAFRFRWALPLRLGRGAVGVEAVAGDGATHATLVEVPPPQRAWWIGLASTFPLRLFEVVALAFVVWGRLPGWTVSIFLPGLALVAAGSIRAALLIQLARSHGRGPGMVALLALCIAELGAGGTMVLLRDPSFDGIALVVSALVFVVPALFATRRRG